ncbi:MAG: class I tRNA ligase family protein, partial [Moorea sp. SIO2B7]|nr:class I tRNA ligase family protein [Moorena sp. SIO2B7]
TIMVTGFDIIFFWVARMTMMAGHFTDQMPFKDVYIHGLVRDEKGKKMSKSANNGIDPLILIEKYGTDALRYTLIKEVAGAGQDITLQYNRKTDESESVEASRNFANKLWNAARFVMMNLDGKTPEELGSPNVKELELSDRWILSRFHQVAQQTKDYIENYALGEGAKGLYDFIWGDFCDWYIELVKSRLRQDRASTSRLIAQQTLAYILEGILKLLHPFMPHITEEIWHTLTQTTDQVLALQAYPEASEAMIDKELEQNFELLFGTIRTIRNLRAEADIKPGIKTPVILQSENPQECQILKSGQVYLKDLGKIEQLTITSSLEQTQAPSLKSGISEAREPSNSENPWIFIPFLVLVPFVLLISFCLMILFFLLSGTKPTKRTKIPQQKQIPLEINLEPSQKVIAGVVGTVQVLIPLTGIVDIDALRAKLEKNLRKVEGEVKSLTSRLNNPGFVNKAPAEIVQNTRDALAEAQKQAEILRERLQRLN